MYEELKIALRNNADHYMTVEGAAGLVHLLTEAADAIEELQQTVDHYKGCSETERSKGGKQMTIVEWATEGLKLANESGKTVDDLIAYLKNSEGLSRFFDKLFPQPVSKTDEFGKSKQLTNSRRYAKWNLDGSCSACGKFSLSTYGNFCCYCGAEMREDEVPESDTTLNNVEG